MCQKHRDQSPTSCQADYTQSLPEIVRDPGNMLLKSWGVLPIHKPANQHVDGLRDLLKAALSLLWLQHLPAPDTSLPPSTQLEVLSFTLTALCGITLTVTDGGADSTRLLQGFPSNHVPGPQGEVPTLGPQLSPCPLPLLCPISTKVFSIRNSSSCALARFKGFGYTPQL